MKNDTVTLESMSQAVWYNQWTLNKFTPFIYGDILEVGCGIGNFTGLLAKYGKIWAVDINQEYIKKNKPDKKINVGFGDIEKGKYFFKEKKFDSIVCLNVLEHIKDDNSAIKNLFTLLKSGGKLILLVPAHQFLYGEIDRSIGHVRRYNKGDLTRRLEETGFKILLSRKLNFLGALGWFIAGRILKEDIVKKGNIKIFNLVAPLVLSLEDLFETPMGTSILAVAQKYD